MIKYKKQLNLYLFLTYIQNNTKQPITFEPLNKNMKHKKSINTKAIQLIILMLLQFYTLLIRIFPTLKQSFSSPQ